MVIAVSASEMVAGAATCVFRPPAAAAPPANAVIAIESAFPARRLTLSRRRGRNRAGITAFYFTGWRGRFITANAGLSTSFSPGDTLRRDNLKKRPLLPPDTVLWAGPPRAKLSGARFP